MSVPVFVIVNAGSGSVLGDETANSLRERFIAFGIKAEVRVAGSGKEIVQLAREAAEGEADLIVAGGGDGTISTIALEASSAGKTLGILPLGTLNNFSKDLGIPQNVNAAVRVIAEGEVRQIDLAEVNGRIFVNNSSIGLYPKMVVRREQQQQKLGRGKWAAAFWASLRLLRISPFLKVDIELEGKVFERKTPFVFVGNNEYEMDMYNIGRRPTLEEGKLSLYFLHREGRWGLVMLLWKTITGGLKQWKDFEAVATEHVTIRAKGKRIRVALDGETTLVEPPLEYRIRPKALKVIVPRDEP
ncbi:MAG: diacylglycerol kinase family lipid kinase [bacterium]|nr:diacylglycerol kinase family lipid kinase [bacterium]